MKLVRFSTQEENFSLMTKARFCSTCFFVGIAVSWRPFPVSLNQRGVWKPEFGMMSRFLLIGVIKVVGSGSWGSVA